MDYKGKKVILIAPKFYEMELEIKTALENQGASVDYFEDKVFAYDSKRNNCYGIRKKFYKFIEQITKRNEKYWKNKIKSFGIYDILIWIDGFSFSSVVIEKLISNNSDINKILYLYDDTTFYNFEQSFKYFDRIDTFDKNDYDKFKEKWNFKYLPLYWIKDTYSDKCEKKYDFSCIGYCIEERLDAIKKLEQSGVFNDKELFIKLYLPSLSFLGYIKQILKYPFFKKDRKLMNLVMGFDKSRFIIRESVPKAQTTDIIYNSKCIVDIVKKTQVGFTNRSMQTIGNGIKILTTNKSLMSAPFYDKEMIYVFDPDNINVFDIRAFMDKTLERKDNEYLDGLEINQWILKL